LAGSASVSPISTSGKPATTNRSPATISSTRGGRCGERHELGELALQRGLALVLLAQRDLLAPAQGAVDDPADGEATEVVGGVEVGDDGLQGGGEVALGRRHGGHDRLEERRQVVVVVGHADARDGLAVAGDGRDDRELDGVLVGVEVEEELVDLVEDLVGAGVLAIDLVEHDHGGQPGGQCLGEHVAGLGRGPSAASTSSTTPSTMVSARSTSPPKSEWPGVSTRLIRMPFQSTEAALARMVMPRSRSWSLESMTRSTRAACSPKVPVARRRASTNVVLPWSTWATSATLRSAGECFRWGARRGDAIGPGTPPEPIGPERGYQAFSSASLSYMHHEA